MPFAIQFFFERSGRVGSRQRLDVLEFDRLLCTLPQRGKEVEEEDARDEAGTLLGGAAWFVRFGGSGKKE